MTPPPKKPTEAEFAGKEHLVRVLSEQVERTFTTEGGTAALSMIGNMLRQLDESALRELAYLQGLTTEHELEPDEAEE